ncbi:MAG: hypothetical protein WCH85_04195 [Methanomicrobiales archaeon]
MEQDNEGQKTQFHPEQKTLAGIGFPVLVDLPGRKDPLTCSGNPDAEIQSGMVPGSPGIAECHEQERERKYDTFDSVAIIELPEPDTGNGQEGREVNPVESDNICFRCMG